MKSKKTVVLGLIGTKLDLPTSRDRWQDWRPTVSILQQEEWLVDRFELLHTAEFAASAASLTADMRMISPETVVRTHPVEFESGAWDFATVYAALHEFARNYPFTPESEDYFVHITTGTHVAQICLFLLTETRHFPAKLLQTSPPRRSRGLQSHGEFDIIDLDLSKYDALATRFAREQTEARQLLKHGIPTKNKAFNSLIDRIEQVALRSREPILLTGPTGAGKSQLARRIYELRQQRSGLAGKFIEVNCATLRGDSSMSTLFGHVKGAFTGAGSERAGLLREADGGVLFLDEIGELGRDEQAMLLRALEDRTFHPFGGDKLVRSDFQLITGTNRDLESRVRDGQFREDLLARLNLWTFSLPGLADRPEDIAPNLDYEMERFSERTGQRISFNKEARETFLKFARSPQARWKANFRDLSGIMTRLATLAPKGRITQDMVTQETTELASRWQKMEPTDRPSGTDQLAALLGAQLEEIDSFDRVQLAYVVKICRESKTQSDAGRKLFSASRKTKRMANDSDRLRKYLARFGLDWEGLEIVSGKS